MPSRYWVSSNIASLASQRSPSDSFRTWPGSADTMETYWDARIDLLQRNISRRKDKLKMRAELALNEIFKGKRPSPDALAENFEREVVKLKLKVCGIEDDSCQSPTLL